MAKVLAVQERCAHVLVDDIVAKVLLTVDGVNPGDWVLLSGGAVLSVLDPDLAAETLDMLREIRGK